MWFPDMRQPPRDHVFVRTTKPETAAGAKIGARLGKRKLAELAGALRSHFKRIEVFLQARRYMAALMSGLPSCNAWKVAEFCGTKRPMGRKGC